MYDILLTDAMVIPVDPEHHIWEKGYIAITGDRIAALGPMEELGGELPQARQHISLKGHVLLPGLVGWSRSCGTLPDQNPGRTPRGLGGYGPGNLLLLYR